MQAELAYLFRHAVLRDAAYELQPPTERARLHALVFRILDSVFEFPSGEAPSPNDVFAEELADHAARGVAHDATLKASQQKLLARAAVYARDHYHVAHAAMLYEQLARLPELTDDKKSGAFIRAARHRQQEGRVKQAEELLSAALEAARRCNKDALIGNALLELSILARKLGQNEQALELCSEAVERCERSGDIQKQTAAWSAMGNLLCSRGDLTGAEEALNKSLGLSRKAGDEVAALGVVTNLLDVYNQTDRHAEAAERLREALDIAVRVGRREIETILRGHLATKAAREGRFDEAESLMLELIAQARETGNYRYAALMLGNLAQLRSDADKLDEAEQTFLQALEACRETGNRPSEALQQANLGVLYSRQGKDAKALKTLAKARELYAQQGNRYFEGWVAGLLAPRRLKAGQAEQAEKDYLHARKILQQFGTADEQQELEEDWQTAGGMGAE